MTKELFITCSPGLEELLEQELKELGFESISKGYCGVWLPYNSQKEIYKLNYCSRIASRVLLPLKHFPCKDRRSLYQEISTIDWSNYIKPGQTFAIDSNVTHNELRNSLFAAQVVKDAICDQMVKRFGQRPSIQLRDPDIQLNLFIEHRRAIISFDTSGNPLHKRGYRQESVEAPLKETLAAALLRLAGYNGKGTFYDPCCGSGTLLIEAALIATHTPPGFFRKKWGFMNLADFSMEEWLAIKQEADQQRIPLEKGCIEGIDINKNAVRVAKTNLRAAGIHQAIEVQHYDFKEYEPASPPTFLITNPPHGRRLGEVESLKPLYRELGHLMKRKMAKPSQGFIFTGDQELAKEVGLAASRRHVVSNSGVDSRLLAFEIY